MTGGGDADCGVEFALVDWFAEVGGDAALDAAVDEVVASSTPVMTTTGRRRPSAASNRAALEAVEVGHVDVEQVKVRFLEPGLFDRLFAVDGWAEWGVSELAESGYEPESDHGIIFSDEDAHRCVGR